jgi:hypothetical protein
MNSDPQGERCCDECDHPAWERSERPLFDHPVETAVASTDVVCEFGVDVRGVVT